VNVLYSFLLLLFPTFFFKEIFFRFTREKLKSFDLYNVRTISTRDGETAFV